MSLFSLGNNTIIVCNNTETLPWFWLGKSVNTSGKNAFKSVKLPSLKMIFWKLTNSRYSSAKSSREILQTFVWWGASSCPHQTKVCQISRLYGAIALLFLGVSPLNLVSYLILRLSFQRCWSEIFAYYSLLKL